MQEIIEAIVEPRRREILDLVRDAELPAGRSPPASTTSPDRPSPSTCGCSGRRASSASGGTAHAACTEPVLRVLRACANSSGCSGTSGWSSCETRPSWRRGGGAVTEALGTEPIVKEIRIDASSETVFAFFTEPEKLTRWLCDETTVDPRPGGVNHQTHRATRTTRTGRTACAVGSSRSLRPRAWCSRGATRTPTLPCLPGRARWR